jgi:hypothetical protein
MRSATAFGRPFASATGLASSLSGCISLTGQRCLFRHRRRCGRFSRILPRPRVLPGSNAPFVPPFSVFRLADLPFGKTARVICSVLVRSNNRLPFGQLRFVRGPKPPPLYFTRLETASYRFLSRGFLFRVTDGARTPSEEPVNPASSPRGSRQSIREGPSQPAWPNLSPVARDYLRDNWFKLSFRPAISFFQ